MMINLSHKVKEVIEDSGDDSLIFVILTNKAMKKEDNDAR